MHITGPSIFVFLLWITMAVVSYKLLSGRTHAVQAQRFLEYAIEVFKRQEYAQSITLLQEHITKIKRIRIDCVKRYMLIQTTQFFVLTLLLATLLQFSVGIINILAAISVGYAIMSGAQVVAGNITVDNICNGWDDELKRLGFEDAFSEAMKAKSSPKEPDDTSDS